MHNRPARLFSKLTLSQPFPLSRERVSFVSLLISCPFATSFHDVMRVKEQENLKDLFLCPLLTLTQHSLQRMDGFRSNDQRPYKFNKRNGIICIEIKLKSTNVTSVKKDLLYTFPIPLPKYALVVAIAADPYPRDLQTTFASFRVQ